MPERLSIAQVTPFAWEEPHEVNEAVRRVSDQLAARGHHVLIVAPSSSAELVREGRKAARAGSGTLPQRADGAPHVIAVGEATLPLGGRSRATLPLDVTRTLTDLFERTTFDRGGALVREALVVRNGIPGLYGLSFEQGWTDRELP